MELKQTSYKFLNGRTSIVYGVRGRRVYFSGLDSNGATKTWAEPSIWAICLEAGIPVSYAGATPSFF